MTRDQIFETIKRNVMDILDELAEDAITEGASLKELGANSIDRADIVVQSMEDLSLNIPLVELGKAKNITA